MYLALYRIKHENKLSICLQQTLFQASINQKLIQKQLNSGRCNQKSAKMPLDVMPVV